MIPLNRVSVAPILRLCKNDFFNVENYFNGVQAKKASSYYEVTSETAIVLTIPFENIAEFPV